MRGGIKVKRLLPFLISLLITTPVFGQTMNILVPDQTTGLSVRVGDDANNAMRVNMVATVTIPVTVATLPLPTGAATEASLSGLLTTQQSALTTLQVIDDLVLPESATHVSGESGVVVLGVRNDAGTTLATDGQRIPLSVDSSGAVRVTGGGGGTQYTEGDTDATITGTAILWETGGNALATVTAGAPLPVTCATCSGTGVQHIDDAAFTPATDDIVPLGGMLDDTTPDVVNEGDAGVVRMSANRNLYSTIRDAAGNERGLNVNAAGNIGIDVAQVLGATHSATNPVIVRQTDGTAVLTHATLDLDTGGGTVSRVSTGIAAAASGGPVAIEGTTANGLEVDVTRVSGTVTVDTELPSSASLADNTANPTVPSVASFLMCFDGTTWDRCLQSLATEATHDGALTVASTVGSILMGRASDVEPTNVTANDDAVVAWFLPSGASVNTLVDAAGDSITDGPNNAVRVNVVAGGAAGGTSSTFGSAFPGTGTAAGFSDGTNMQPGNVSDLDTGAGTVYTQNIRIVRAAAGGPTAMINQAPMSLSIPVVIASDQTAVPVSATNLSTNVAQVGGTTTVTAGVSGLLAVGGAAAHDAAVSGNPVLIAGSSSAAAPTSVSADGEAVSAWFLRNGAQATQSTFSGTLASVNNGTVDGGTLRVTIASNSTGQIAITGAALTSLQLIDDTVLAIGSTTSGQVGGLIMGAVTTAAPTYTTAQTHPLSLATDGSLRVAGSVSCSNCSGSGASDVDDSSFTIATDSVAPAGFLLDDTTPDSVDEGDVGLARMSANRVQYQMIRDAAGNERGANVNASNELLVNAVVSSFPDNEPINLAQIAGATTLTGNGATGTGSIRVTIADDNSLINGFGNRPEDGASATGQTLTVMGSVRADVAASSSGTNGDYSWVHTDALGQVWTRQLDPCTGVAKTTIPIDIVTATTTELTAALAGASNHYYVCSLNLVTAGANNVALVDDDTDNCASVTSGLAGGVTAAEGWNFAANGGLTQGNGGSTIMKTNGTNRVLCLVTSAAVQLSGTITVAAAP